MDRIVIPVSELLKKAKELSKDGMKYVEIVLMEADKELPACISFNGTTSKDDPASIDYEEINAVTDVLF